ncbi:hypothetical protein T12_7709 [Trichinella patagoniensis]|uniref:Uncharacterized protein n=1 Tax=Trichinella patagoniensis TaxID=990121 RepID=A0A0V1A917_9BILA|nr:hypothetical protein T12_7709 [Trichinella patagoniensis]
MQAFSSKTTPTATANKQERKQLKLTHWHISLSAKSTQCNTFQPVTAYCICLSLTDINSSKKYGEAKTVLH